MKKILLTGFDPFGGDRINPALEAVKRVHLDSPEVELCKLEVPTVFGTSIETVTGAMDRLLPDAVVCVGQAGGRKEITPERVAINFMDARIPDNRGNQPEEEAVIPGGPAAYFSTLPVKAMASAIKARGLPAAVSNTAGTFVCNHLMYGVLAHAAAHFPSMKAGFVHVPFLPEQAKNGAYPSLTLEQITEGLQAALEAVFAENSGSGENWGKES